MPRVSDGVIFRVLNNLLILDGERLSDRTLDVEQIGSVHEKMMGFELHIAAGRSIAIKPKKSSGAPAAINLEELLSVASSNRAKWLKGKTDQELTGRAADTLKQAQTIEELLAALDRRIASDATPNVVPKGAMMFQPRTNSHLPFFGQRRCFHTSSRFSASRHTMPLAFFNLACMKCGLELLAPR